MALDFLRNMVNKETNERENSLHNDIFLCSGDGGVDLNPIGDLLKSEVRQIGRELQIDQMILDAKPTDGLFEDSRTDEDQLGATYDEIEWAMKLNEKGKEISMKNFTNREKQVMEIYLKRHKDNEHKLRPIPRCLIPKELR